MKYTLGYRHSKASGWRIRHPRLHLSLDSYQPVLQKKSQLLCEMGPQRTSHESLAHAASRGIGTELCSSSGKDILHNGAHIIYRLPAVYQVQCETWDPESPWHFRSSGRGSQATRSHLVMCRGPSWGRCRLLGECFIQVAKEILWSM